MFLEYLTICLFYIVKLCFVWEAFLKRNAKYFTQSILKIFVKHIHKLFLTYKISFQPLNTVFLFVYTRKQWQHIPPLCRHDRLCIEGDTWIEEGKDEEHVLVFYLSSTVTCRNRQRSANSDGTRCPLPNCVHINCLNSTNA